MRQALSSSGKAPHLPMSGECGPQEMRASCLPARFSRGQTPGMNASYQTEDLLAGEAGAHNTWLPAWLLILLLS